MSPRDDGQDFLGDYGALGALPIVLAFWLLVLAGCAVGLAIHDLLIATEVVR